MAQLFGIVMQKQRISGLDEDLLEKDEMEYLHAGNIIERMM